MAAVPQVNIVAQKRVPFDDTIPDFRGDYSGATPLMEIRPDPGGSGDPLVSLGASTAGSEGIAITYDADYAFEYRGVTYTGASLVQIIIDEATLEGLSYGADPADPVVLYYDIHLTPSSATKFVMASGTFTIDPGVTR
jgi:hypothetical protein